MVAGFLLLASGARVEPTYTLREVPQAGARSVATVRIEFRLSKETVVDSFRSERTILTVGKDGTLTVREVISERSLKRGGTEIRNDKPLVRTVRMDARGNEIEELDDDGDSVANPEPISDSPILNREAETFALDHLALAYGYAPKSPVALGSEWTPPMDERLNLYPLAFRLVAEAKGELTLTGSGDGREGTVVACTVLVDAATFRRKRTTVRITKVPIAGEDGEAVPEGRIEIEVVAKAG